MVSSSAVLTFVLATFVFAIVPGPSALFIVGRALALGRAAAVRTVLGNLVGLLILVLVASIGVGAFLQQMSGALLALKIAGGSYLIWLGWIAFHQRGDVNLQAELSEAHTRRSALVDLRQGLTVGLTNPKALVFLVAILPQFVAVGSAHPSLQMFALGLVFCAMGSSMDVVWAIAAGSAREWFVSSPVRLRRIRGTGGLIVMGLGVGVLATGHRQD